MSRNNRNRNRNVSSRLGPAAGGFFASAVVFLVTIAPVYGARESTQKHSHSTPTPPTGLVAWPSSPRPARSVEEEHAMRRDQDPEPAEEAPATTTPKPKPRTPSTTTESEAALPTASAVADEITATINARAASTPMCRRANGPEGRGVAELRFKGDGSILIALPEPFARTEVGACIARRFASAGRHYDEREGTLVLKVAFSI